LRLLTKNIDQAGYISIPRLYSRCKLWIFQWYTLVCT